MKVFYIPWLHFHQPYLIFNGKLVSNLEKMIFSSDSKERWDGYLIARAYKNPADFVYELRNKGFDAKIALDFSGILLEQLVDLEERKIFNQIEIQGKIVDGIISMYEKVFEEFLDSFELAGSAYAHAYFPSIPHQDWDLQIKEWKACFSKIFGKKILERVKGFWLPELGVPAWEDLQVELIKTLKKNGYEWLILPLSCINGYEKLDLKERLRIATQKNLVKVADQEFFAFFRIPPYFIDQQSGCPYSQLLKKLIELKEIVKKDCIAIPASDGENGNVMMNEFFPQTFLPFFQNLKQNEKLGISTCLISEFFEEKDYYKVLELKQIGSSWLGTHKFWLEGSKREKILERIEELSKKIREKNLLQVERIKRIFLIAETSCYLYWGSNFWFSQAEKILQILERIVESES